MIIEQLTVGPVAANCYILGCESTHSGVVIDPGDEAPRILRTIERLQLKIAWVLLTHAHFDHISAAKVVSETVSARLALHEEDLPLLRAGGGATFFGLPTPPYKAPDEWVDETTRFRFGEYTAAVLFVPGHSPGHVAFYVPDAHAVFTGDTLFAGSIGRTDLPGSDYETLIDSISHQLMVLPDDTLVYPGHGPRTTIGKERVSNPFL